jgi:hypothetical protein
VGDPGEHLKRSLSLDATTRRMNWPTVLAKGLPATHAGAVELRKKKMFQSSQAP